MSYTNSSATSTNPCSKPSYYLTNNFCKECNASTSNSVSSMPMMCNSLDSTLLQPRRTPIRTRSGINSRQISRTHSFVGDRSKNVNHDHTADGKQMQDNNNCNSFHYEHQATLLQNLLETSAEKLCSLSEREAEVQAASGSSAAKDAKARFVYAIDHLSTKLQIPMCAVEPTMAMEDDGLVPGLCRLYMEGRCRQGERCYQVHADPSVISQLRLVAHQTPSCCHVHGAVCNFEDFPPGLTVTIESAKERDGLISHEERHRQRGLPNYCSMSEICEVSTGELSAQSRANGDNDARNTTPLTPLSVAENKSILVPLTSLNPTSFLWKLYRENGTIHLHTSSARVCREHRKGLCKFGDECNFLHVCRAIQLHSNDTCPNLSRNTSINNFSRHWSESTTCDNTPRPRYDKLSINTQPNVISRTQSLQFSDNTSALNYLSSSARERDSAKLLGPSNSMPDLHFCDVNNTHKNYNCYTHNKTFSKTEVNSPRDKNTCTTNLASNRVRLGSQVNEHNESFNVQYSQNSNDTVLSQSAYPAISSSISQELPHAYALNIAVNNNNNNKNNSNKNSSRKAGSDTRMDVTNGKCNCFSDFSTAFSSHNNNDFNHINNRSSSKNNDLNININNSTAASCFNSNTVNVTPIVENEMFGTQSNKVTVVTSNTYDASSDTNYTLSKQHSMSEVNKNCVPTNNNSFVNNFSLAASTANSFAGFVEVNNINSAYSDNNYADNNIEQNNFSRLLCPLASHSPTPVSTPLTQKSFSHNPYGETRSMNEESEATN